MKLTPKQREQILNTFCKSIGYARWDDYDNGNFYNPILVNNNLFPEQIENFAIRCVEILNGPKSFGTSPHMHFVNCMELLLSLDAQVHSVEMDKVPSGHLLYGAYINAYKNMHYILSHFYVKTVEGYEK